MDLLPQQYAADQWQHQIARRVDRLGLTSTLAAACCQPVGFASRGETAIH